MSLGDGTGSLFGFISSAAAGSATARQIMNRVRFMASPNEKSGRKARSFVAARLQLLRIRRRRRGRGAALRAGVGVRRGRALAARGQAGAGARARGGRAGAARGARVLVLRLGLRR